MAAANPILTPDRGKAHSVALLVLCVLAVVQVSAMVRAVWLAKSKSIQPQVVTAPSADSESPTGAPPLPASAQAISKLIPPPSIPGTEPVAPVSTSPAVFAAKSKPASTAFAPPLSAELQEEIETAQQLRPLGDLKGALDVLQHADSKSPDHPKILTEMAQTYQMMGMADKATAMRQRVASIRMKSEAALATASERGASLSPSTGLTTPDARAADPSKILAIGTCEVIRDWKVTKGEKVTLRMPIRSRPGAVIDPAAIDIDVFFFDLVNGEKVEQTKADVPVNTWVDSPVDWKDGQERLDVLYSMPEMTTDVIRSIGQRKFHGYIVKLYYDHKLQDTVMEPASLQNYGAGVVPQTSGNPLLPPVAR